MLLVVCFIFGTFASSRLSLKEGAVIWSTNWDNFGPDTSGIWAVPFSGTDQPTLLLNTSADGWGFVDVKMTPSTSLANVLFFAEQEPMSDRPARLTRILLNDDGSVVPGSNQSIASPNFSGKFALSAKSLYTVSNSYGTYGTITMSSWNGANAQSVGSNLNYYAVGVDLDAGRVLAAGYAVCGFLNFVVQWAPIDTPSPTWTNLFDCDDALRPLRPRDLGTDMTIVGRNGTTVVGSSTPVVFDINGNQVLQSALGNYVFMDVPLAAASNNSFFGVVVADDRTYQLSNVFVTTPSSRPTRRSLTGHKLGGTSNLVSSIHVHLPNCPFNCSGAGLCVLGKCQCNGINYGAGCQASCVASSSCSGKGICSPINGTCLCNMGFYGQFCEHEIPHPKFPDQFVAQLQSCNGSNCFFGKSFHAQASFLADSPAGVKRNGRLLDYLHGLQYLLTSGSCSVKPLQQAALFASGVPADAYLSAIGPCPGYSAWTCETWTGVNVKYLVYSISNSTYLPLYVDDDRFPFSPLSLAPQNDMGGIGNYSRPAACQGN